MSLKRAARFDELKTAGQLPSPTGVALEILRLARDDRVATEQIARVVQTDPALAGRILRIANSTHAGVRRPVAAITEAIKLLEPPALRAVTLGFAVLSSSQRGPCKRFDYQTFWSASLATAIAARSLAHSTNTMPADEAFTCGLLSQSGRLALASVYPDEYADVLDRWNDGPPGQLLQLEHEAFATDHNEVSAALVKDWGLPEVLVRAILYHEDPQTTVLQQGSRPKQLATLLHVAARLAAICSVDDQSPQPQLEELFAGCDSIRIDPATLVRLCDQIVSQWHEASRMLEGTGRSLSAAEMVPMTGPSASTAASEPSSSRPEQAERLQILVADDDPMTLRALTKLLTAAGHSVIAADDGREALRLALDTKPQLLVADWLMPEMDGLDLCRSLRKTKAGRQMYVIILTIRELEDDLVESFEAGADDYVAKPFSSKVLTSRIRAGARVIRLQDEVARDKEEIRRYASELAMANRRLQQAALTDPMTDLPNRRFAAERLVQEWAAASRSGRPMSCIMIDIDDFKQVNDTYGHHAGDAVLRETGDALTSNLRVNDMACRFGGDEFLIICGDSDIQSTKSCAARILKQIAANVVQVGNSQCRVSVSAGLAERDPTMPNPEALVKAADQALYAAKHAGRNCLRLATEKPKHRKKRTLGTKK